MVPFVRLRSCFLLAALLLAGCGGNFSTAYRLRSIKPAASAIATMDAKQRNVLIVQRGSDVARMCAEPSPDVFSVFAQSLGGGVKGGTSGPQQVEAAANFALSRAENGATISRTQTSNVVREMLYRTCERYLNGAIGAEQFAIQAIRDQRMVVSILAIEQLTGLLAPPTVILRADAKATSDKPDGPATATTGGEGTVVPGPGRPSDAQMTAVTDAVRAIVDKAYGQDEFLLFCIGHMDSTEKSALAEACTRYVVGEVDLLAKTRNLPSYQRTLQGVAVRESGDFDRFWSRIVDPATGTSDVAKVKAAIAGLAGGSALLMPAILQAMQAAPLSRDAMLGNFHNLAPVQQQALGKGDAS